MLGKTIASYRRKLGLTQEQLAQRLDVTNQAVSKWETDQSCPDTLLLPRIADVFEISIDALFGRESVQAAQEEPKVVQGLPWKDDGAFHIVVYHGHTLIGAQPEKAKLTFEYEGPAKDIYCAMNVSCADVQGNVSAEGYVECGDVGGSANAGGYVECGDVNGNVNAGGYAECGDVNGNIMAGSYVECGDVAGSVNALAHVECGDVGGSVTSDGGNVDSDDAHGFSFGSFFGFGKK